MKHYVLLIASDETKYGAIPGEIIILSANTDNDFKEILKHHYDGWKEVGLITSDLSAEKIQKGLNARISRTTVYKE